MSEWLYLLLIPLAVFLLSALPLYFSVKVMGGKTGLLKIIIVNIIVALVAFAIKMQFDTWGGVIAFILMILIYKYMFKIGWIRAILVWLLQFVFAVIIFLFLGLIVGMALFI